MSETEPEELPLVELHRPRDDDSGEPRRGARTWWFVVTAAVIVVVGGVVGVLVFNSSAPRPARGTRTAPAAARSWVSAVNAGKASAAVAVACDTFADDSRSAARSGSQGYRLTLDGIRSAGRDDATALMTQRLTLPGGKVERSSYAIAIQRTGGRWLMCGRLT